MRQYEPLWNLIKDNKGYTVKLDVESSTHPKITQAVKKEKHKDINFKASYPNLVLKIISDIEKDTLSISLVKKTNRLNL